MSSNKGKADLWRTGKNGDSKPFNKLKGNDLPTSLDNKGVFANSTAGLARDAACASASPGDGRNGLDMYTAGGSGKSGLDMAKAPAKEKSGF